jgi:3-hydroxyisobutyrate dehydrogenase
MSASEQIGFVGLGMMGTPMVRRLASAGAQVHVFDVNSDAVTALAAEPRVVAHTTVASVVDAAETIILMLPNSKIVAHVLLADGLLEQARPGSYVIDMSSSEPHRTQELAREAERHNVMLVDAPVSGGVSGAVNGTLTIMVGGSDEAFAHVQRILAPLGKRILHAGGVGSGHAVKALNNMMSATHLLASSEALVAARRFGLDPEVVLDIVNGSSGRSGSTEQKWPRFVLPETYDSGFAMSLMLKDMKIALELEHATGVPSALGEAAVAAWQAADAELAGADHTEIVKWLEMNSQTPEEIG